MAMEKRGSVPVTPTTEKEDMVKTAGIVKCSKCGQMYLEAHGSCPHCK